MLHSGNTNSKHIGRVGALATALGVGAALVATPAISWADATQSGPSDTSTQAPHTSSSTAATPSPGVEEARDAGAARDGTPAAAGDDTAAADMHGVPGESASTDDSPRVVDVSEGRRSSADASELGAARPETGDDDTEGEALDELLAEVPHSGAKADAAADRDSGSRRRSAPGASPDDAAPTRESVPAADSRSTATRELVATRADTEAVPPAAATAVQVTTAPATTMAQVTASVTNTPPTQPALPDIPAALAQVTSHLIAMTFGPLLSPAGPEPSAPSAALWAVMAWARREIEQTLFPATGPDAPSAAAAAVNAPTAIPLAANATQDAADQLPILGDTLAWFQRTFDNATPVFAAQTAALTLAKNQTSQPLSLNGYDPDGDLLTYSIDGSTTGTGSAGGSVAIAGGAVTYTPPATWNATTPFDDVFTVTTSDADNGFHIHGLPGLLHALTFGLLGDAGHTATATMTVHVAPVGDPQPGIEGTFPVSFVNNTRGIYRNDQIYVTVMGQTTPGNWSWVDSTGTAHPIDHTAADAPGHLVKNGVNFANMSFTLDQAANLRIPPELQGARVYVSMGQPLYIGISENDQGWAVPDPANPINPNFGTVYDWYELTYQYQKIPFGGNTTQVDQFGLPLKVTLEQTSSGFSEARGITLPRDQVFATYAATLPAAFQALVIKDAAGNPLRIIAPRTTQPGELATWLDEPVNAFWTKYASQQFTYTNPGYTVTGGINAANQFAYTVTTPGGASTSYTMQKPATAEVFAANGAFVGVGLQGAFLAELNAAFNRGVAATPDKWATVSAYYPPGVRWNAFAKLFHDLGIGGYAYGFPYDDVNSQSSVVILGNSQPPSNLTISVGW